VIVFDEQVHSALNRAIRAVCGHDTIDHAIRAPAIVWRIVKMRSKLLDDLIQVFDLIYPVAPKIETYLCGSLRTSAISALKGYFNAEIAKIRREPQRNTQIRSPVSIREP